VTLRPEAAAARGLSGLKSGWVQDVRWATTEFRFDVLFAGDAEFVRVDDLPEEDLLSLGPRGAAGLGELL